ncbi:stage III sporulation protein AH [Clostridium sp. CAG:762]|jgi:stage III sporulation protein AH|nr:stage III sporulation protein AH [Clostridium sp. CAG:762]
MINKKNLWFLTLFSLVLVLSVYYVTMPSELLVTGNGKVNVNNKNNDKDKNVSVKESDILTSLRVEADNQLKQEMDVLKQVLTNTDVSVDEKNSAFEELKLLNQLKGKEEKLEDLVKSTYNLGSFIKIDNDQIRVVVESTDTSASLANNIMRTIQDQFDNKMYISVKFQ